MAVILFSLAYSELGVSSSTVNTILLIASLLVIGLPLWFVSRSQSGFITSRKVKL
ncbi:hypothetical protein [Prochlorococcus marinus]|uniref:hypothetical protein n=1 Tax=Prochlorococcus marinus TaxID=1219 RepID=UPI0022B322AE|nr:hypothetical protein [Prochlorococcus marinus]